ncbi:protein of unknown function [Pararobbsia alpina]
MGAAEASTQMGGTTPYYDFQYFTLLRRAATGRDVALQFLYDHVGDERRANNPLVSNSVQTFPDLMQIHQVECRSTSAPISTGSPS